MSNLYSTSVFYVTDAERALRFYTDTLGFGLDWNYAPNGSAFVFQVELLGFQLIINEVEASTESKAGRGAFRSGNRPTMAMIAARSFNP